MKFVAAKEAPSRFRFQSTSHHEYYATITKCGDTYMLSAMGSRVYLTASQRVAIPEVE